MENSFPEEQPPDGGAVADDLEPPDGPELPDELEPPLASAELPDASEPRDSPDLPDDPAGRLRVLVEAVAGELDPAATVEVVETEESLTATVSGGDPSLFIGKHGSTIDAVQHLAARAAFRGASERKAVVVDADGYRARREAALIRAADRAVADALSGERPIELDPMSAAERRVVHTYLKDRTDVQTHSEGEEPDRRLVVTPVRAPA